jgi:diguanylate cyclase (GGDEF)-like protein
LRDDSTEQQGSDSTGRPAGEAWGGVDGWALNALDQTASDRDQASSDRDQTSSDEDQTTADRNQTSADFDQSASEEDQAASDGESVEGADQRSRDLGAAHREHATDVRDKQARDRERAAVSREITADDRDEVASTRDEITGVREASAYARSNAGQPPGTVDRDQTRSAARDRELAVEDRRNAAADRHRAASDRLRAAEERARAARDRAIAAQDRAQAALDREASETDDLTRVRRRGPGMKQLQREIDRAHRTAEELMLTFIDVDDLKTVNDSMGHQAGDALLVAVADALRQCTRSYDLIMRYGGDEFVCALPNADASGVRERFAQVSTVLATGPVRGSISVGYAPLGDAATAKDLVHRADTDLLARRAGRGEQE